MVPTYYFGKPFPKTTWKWKKNWTRGRPRRPTRHWVRLWNLFKLSWSCFIISSTLVLEYQFPVNFKALWSRMKSEVMEHFNIFSNIFAAAFQPSDLWFCRLTLMPAQEWTTKWSTSNMCSRSSHWRRQDAEMSLSTSSLPWTPRMFSSFWTWLALGQQLYVKNGQLRYLPFDTGKLIIYPCE